MKPRIVLLLIIIVSFLVAGNTPSALAASLKQNAEAYGDEAVSEIFDGSLPKGYQVQQGGVMDYPDKTHGYYLILTETISDTVIFIADIRSVGRHQGVLLEKGPLKNVASHLLTRYMKSAPLSEIKVNLEKLTLPSGHQGAVHLTVLDAKGLARPKLITRLQYGKKQHKPDRTVVLLLGLPSEDTPKEEKRDFSQTFQRLESEARRVIVHLRPSERLLPTERYILWRVRQIFW